MDAGKKADRREIFRTPTGTTLPTHVPPYKARTSMLARADRRCPHRPPHNDAVTGDLRPPAINRSRNGRDIAALGAHLLEPVVPSSIWASGSPSRGVVVRRRPIGGLGRHLSIAERRWSRSWHQAANSSSRTRGRSSHGSPLRTAACRGAELVEVVNDVRSTRRSRHRVEGRGPRAPTCSRCGCSTQPPHG